MACGSEDLRVGAAYLITSILTRYNFIPIGVNTIGANWKSYRRIKGEASLDSRRVVNQAGHFPRVAFALREKSQEPDYDTLVKIANYFKVSIDYLLGRTQDPEMVLDADVRQFVDSLNFPTNASCSNFLLTIDGKQLTAEEAKRFIAFVRAERSL